MYNKKHTEYFEGLILMPPFAPPKGTSTTAHLYVIRVANACTSSISTSSLYLIPGEKKIYHIDVTLRKPCT